MTSTLVLIVLLVLAGMVLFLLEVITPMFGLLAGLGVAALAAAVWQGFAAVHATFGWLLLLALIALMPVYVVWLVKWLPHSPVGRRLFLRKNVRVEPGEGTPEADENRALVGKTGVAETMLRPSGAVRIDGQRVIALSESGTIAKGSKVTVIRAPGTNIIVRPAETEA